MSDTLKGPVQNQAGIDRLKSTSVLYVEDDPDIREQLSQFLKRRVAKLYTATNGQEGLDIWRLHKPEVVVTDIMIILDVKHGGAFQQVDAGPTLNWSF